MTANAKWTVAISTVLLWAIGCCLYFYWSIWTPDAPPITDNYGGNPKVLALLGFTLFRLPFLVIALFAILYFEAIICKFLFKKEKRRPAL